MNEIYQLRGEGDYRFVTLHWQYPTQLAGLHGFQVDYCELQAWGPNRCRSKFLDASSGVPYMGDPEFRAYSVIVNGLRMATNYSFEVQPRESRRTRFYVQPPASAPWNLNPAAERIVVTTKGFSARASLCLPTASEVEVWTGPYFSGRIAVEVAAGVPGPCSVDGDPTSPQDSYTLRIDHDLCGSKVNRTAVETFILVQENLPILTHSTRRFLVLCTFQPETLTVRAGLNLPHTSNGVTSPEAAEVDNQVHEHNNVHASALQLSDESARAYAEQVSEAHTVMLCVVIAAGLVVIGLTVWWFMPLKTKSRRQSILSDDTTYTSNSTVDENYENSIRDSELDFETANDVCEERDENILREGVCNEILQETCVSLNVDWQDTIRPECATQSEA
ncbi:uncharacterized protein LOC129000482 [Macrosteles quadrilineatus]|uniref:uncharacterized protein LOC129000482 n=1 Tax=Macrosteles quadrilineatus TaxID=74068 RepID=UPI0023E13287|nr:uncharacterized protein LOC129000482 [Macrosteles quadrilineatus]